MLTDASFVTMPKWFSELPEDTRRQFELQRDHYSTELSPDFRVIPKSHGDKLVDQLAAGKARFLELSEPKCIIRIGDCELGLLAGGFLPSERTVDLATQMRIAGYDADAFHLRSSFISAISETPLVGVHQDAFGGAVRRDTAVLFRMLNLPVPFPNGVEVHLPYHLFADGTLFSYLAGKNVLLIGSLAPALHAAFASPTFLDFASNFGPARSIRFTECIATKPGGPNSSAYRDIDDIVRKATSIKHDVALIACGTSAKIIAWRLWKNGTTALDIGYVFDALLGGRGRTRRPGMQHLPWATLDPRPDPNVGSTRTP